MYGERLKNPINLLFPWLLKYHITPADRLYGRNRKACHDLIHENVLQRKAEKTKAEKGEEDVLDMFLSEEVY